MSNKEKVLPFHLLYKDSMFRIFSEPSRNISRSTDKRVYRKVCDAYSVEVVESTGRDVEPERAIILRPNDLCSPLPRPQSRRFTRN